MQHFIFDHEMDEDHVNFPQQIHEWNIVNGDSVYDKYGKCITTVQTQHKCAKW